MEAKRLTKNNWFGKQSILFIYAVINTLSDGVDPGSSLRLWFCWIHFLLVLQRPSHGWVGGCRHRGKTVCLSGWLLCHDLTDMLFRLLDLDPIHPRGLCSSVGVLRQGIQGIPTGSAAVTGILRWLRRRHSRWLHTTLWLCQIWLLFALDVIRTLFWYQFEVATLKPSEKYGLNK